jgi:hypothetical protein
MRNWLFNNLILASLAMIVGCKETGSPSQAGSATDGHDTVVIEKVTPPNDTASTVAADTITKLDSSAPSLKKLDVKKASENPSEPSPKAREMPMPGMTSNHKRQMDSMRAEKEKQRKLEGK